jgi:hypothetical protein
VRALIVGWPSFLHGEATAGDVLSMRRVHSALTGSGIPADLAFSPVFQPESLHLEDTDPARYTHVLFVCGPAHGSQVRGLHRRFFRCRRIAVGVSVIDPEDEAVTGFHRVLARDGLPGAPARDLSASARTHQVPVVGVVLAPGQGEYGPRRRHDGVHRRLADWLAAQDCARVPLDTRLEPGNWRLCSTADQFASLLARVDVVVTSRLHGLVLALRQGVPALALDPVAGGGKVCAQAQAWGWPAVLPAESVLDGERGSTALNQCWDWCRSEASRQLAACLAATVDEPGEPLISELLRALRGTGELPAS